MSTHSHVITIEVTGKNQHGPAEKASVTVEGDGKLQHAVHTFAAFLTAAGFGQDTVRRVLDVLPEE